MSAAGHRPSPVLPRPEPGWEASQSNTLKEFLRAHDRERRKAWKRKQRRTGEIADPGAGVLAVAVRLLPAADRARYAEEFLGELRDLARSGGGRGRLRYALRQLLRTVLMGLALRSPRRRSAAP